MDLEFCVASISLGSPDLGYLSRLPGFERKGYHPYNGLPISGRQAAPMIDQDWSAVVAIL